MCFARPKNQWQCPAPARLVSLCEHEARVGAAKTANRFMRLRGSTHVLCIVQTAAVIAWMQAFEYEDCLHVGACAQDPHVGLGLHWHNHSLPTTPHMLCECCLSLVLFMLSVCMVPMCCCLQLDAARFEIFSLQLAACTLPSSCWLIILCLFLCFAGYVVRAVSFGCPCA